jgi:hypothetical protein
MIIIEEELCPLWSDLSHYYENLWGTFAGFQLKIINEIKRLEQENFSSSCRSPCLIRPADLDRSRRLEINKLLI